MARISTVKLHGKSGNDYEFEVWPRVQTFRPVAAVYAVTQRYQNNQGGYSHTVIYVGQTENLEARHEDHHKEDCFDKHNANCICTHRDDDEDSRLAKEADLIANYNPVCNG
jgi:hypothetical protein